MAFPFAQNKPDKTYIKENYTKKEVYIPMRDGVKLFTSIYIPKNISKDKIKGYIKKLCCYGEQGSILFTDSVPKRNSNIVL